MEISAARMLPLESPAMLQARAALTSIEPTALAAGVEPTALAAGVERDAIRPTSPEARAYGSRNNGTPSDVAGVPPATSPEDAAAQLESLFASLLIKEMRATLSEGLFGSDSADAFGALFDQHLGRQMAEGEGLGIKQFILQHDTLGMTR